MLYCGHSRKCFFGNVGVVCAVVSIHVILLGVVSLSCVLRALEKNGKASGENGDADISPTEAQPSSDLDQPSLSHESKPDDSVPLPPITTIETQALSRAANSQPLQRATHTNSSTEAKPYHPPATSTAATSIVSITMTTSASISRPVMDHITVTMATTSISLSAMTTPTSSPRKGKKEEGWKEVGKRYCSGLLSVLSHSSLFHLLSGQRS